MQINVYRYRQVLGFINPCHQQELSMRNREFWKEVGINVATMLCLAVIVSILSGFTPALYL
mgnify:CR=1 FL=1|jgi:hypothetical protein|tara:strand:- start:2780 stop:2962 length:183 start_codon:yes stop_codon:yes gene_type:complete